MNTRAKGVAFEREVAIAFESSGFEVRGLESAGDHLVIGADDYLLHVEAKRCERLRIPEWLAQLERDAPKGCRRALIYRQSRHPAYVVETLEQFLERESKLAGALALFTLEDHD